MYVSDLDGTLLRDDATLSGHSRDLLNRVTDAGFNVGVASARSYVSMRPILEGLRLTLPVIEFNGAYITNWDTGEHEVVNAIGPSIVARLYDAIAGDSGPPIVSAHDGRRDSIYRSPRLNEGITAYLEGRRVAADPRLRPPTDPRDHLDEQVICLTAIDRRERLEPLAARLEREFAGQVQVHCFADYYVEGWYWLTVHDERATKARALERIMPRYGAKPGDLVVFGDQANDLSMFELAGRAVAVSNAVDSVRAAADETIGANETDSVANYIARHAGLG